MINPQFCMECQELIPNATMRKRNDEAVGYYCADCWGETAHLSKWTTGANTSVEMSEMQYHGGRFNNAEW